MFSFRLPFYNQSKNDDARPVLSNGRAQVIAPDGGALQHAAEQDEVFSHTLQAGVVLPAFSNVAQVFGLWNPGGSGVIAYIKRLTMAYVDTTGAAGGFVWGFLRDAGTQIGTAAPISAFTETQAERGVLQSAKGGNKVKALSAITVTTGLMTIGRATKINQFVLTAATTSFGTFEAGEEYDGDFGLAPNNAIFLCGSIATLSKWIPTVTWREKKI